MHKLHIRGHLRDHRRDTADNDTAPTCETSNATSDVALGLDSSSCPLAEEQSDVKQAAGSSANGLAYPIADAMACDYSFHDDENYELGIVEDQANGPDTAYIPRHPSTSDVDLEDQETFVDHGYRHLAGGAAGQPEVVASYCRPPSC